MKRRAAMLALGCATLTLTGCYERVVGAKGFGADRAQVERPNDPGGRPTNLVTRRTTVKEIQNPGTK